MIYGYPYLLKKILDYKCLPLLVGEAFFMPGFNSHRSYAPEFVVAQFIARHDG